LQQESKILCNSDVWFRKYTLFKLGGLVFHFPSSELHLKKRWGRSAPLPGFLFDDPVTAMFLSSLDNAAMTRAWLEILLKVAEHRTLSPLLAPLLKFCPPC
jgi:hypothetical protein